MTSMRKAKPFAVCGQFLKVAALLLLPSAVNTETIDVPSGQSITFHDVIWEQEDGVSTYRFRYIAPDITRGSGGIDFATAEPDLKFLCETSALAALKEQNRGAGLIVITLSDRPVEFGKANPDATQFIDAFRPDGGTCAWEGY